MTKRLGDFSEGHSKKPKSDLDHLWGDDFDVQDVDECFQLASQRFQQEVICTQQNTSILPSYNAFKQQTKRSFTSTQSNPELNSTTSYPSTSKNGYRTNGITHNTSNTFHFNNHNNAPDVESKLRKVQDQYSAKEGEVSILRGQLKDIKFQNDKDNLKKEKDWSEKYNNATREMTAVKSELEFKNIEIVNLKQKLAEKIKAVSRDSALQLTQNQFFKRPKNGERCSQFLNQSVNESIVPPQVVKQTVYDDFTVYNKTENYYPLQYLIEACLFDPPCTAEINIPRVYESTSSLGEQTSTTVVDSLKHVHPKTTRLPNGRDLNIDFIQMDILNLMKCTSHELETGDNYTRINKIVCTSEQLCDNLNDFLTELEKGFVMDNLETVDISYLKKNFNITNSTTSLFSPRDWFDGEMGKSARQSITCMAHILPHSSYLRQYLLENKRLTFKGDEDYLNHISVAKSKCRHGYSNNNYYLSLILSIVNKSGKLRNSQAISGFLSAVCLLLDKIYSCELPEDIQPLLTKLTREIVFVCPNTQVLSRLSELFKSAAVHSVFVMNLCTMSSRGSLKVEQVDKQNVCILQIFCTLVECSSTNGKCDKIVDLYSTVMVFIISCFKVKFKWMHYQQDEYCDCLCKIVKLSVDILYQVVEEYKNICSICATSRKNDYYAEKLSRFTDLLRNGIDVLHILKSKADDIIVKYLWTHSHFMIVVKSLMILKDSLKLTETQVQRLQDLTDSEGISLMEVDTSNKSLWN